MSDRGTPVTSPEELEAIAGTPEPRTALDDTTIAIPGPAYGDRIYG